MSTRVERYIAAGNTLAATAIDLGLPFVVMDKWALYLARLAESDDVCEARPEEYSDPSVLLNHFGLDPNNTDLRIHASGLISASIGATTSEDLDEHFCFRELEAVHCVGLLKGFNLRTIHSHRKIWNNIERLTVASAYFDDVLDAREDAEVMPQFTAYELAYGAMNRFLKERKSIDNSVWISLLRASIEYCPKRQLSKPFLAISSLVAVSLSPQFKRTGYKTSMQGA